VYEPILIVVEPRTKLSWISPEVLEQLVEIWANTRILLVVLLGVMVADNPVTSTMLVDVVVNALVLVVLTHCKAAFEKVVSTELPRVLIELAPSLTYAVLSGVDHPNVVVVAIIDHPILV
jgi:formate hydrogenlyase subunit 4